MQTPLCRAAFPYIFTPKTDTDQQTGVAKTKYKVTLLFDESAKDGLQELINDAYAEGVKKFGEHFWALVQQGSVKWPFRNGGEINPKTGQPRFGAGITYINCTSHDKPDVVSRWAAPGTTKPAVVTDPAQLWPGEYVKASVTVKPYDMPTSKGIAVYVNALQLWHEGDRLDNRVAGEDAFDAEGEQPAAQMQQPPAYNPEQPAPTVQPPQATPPTAAPQGGPPTQYAQPPAQAPVGTPAGAPQPQGQPQGGGGGGGLL